MFSEKAIILSDGNPGAITVLVELSSLLSATLLRFDLLESSLDFLNNNDITGHKIWLLYKDYCRSDIIAFLANLSPLYYPNYKDILV